MNSNYRSRSQFLHEAILLCLAVLTFCSAKPAQAEQTYTSGDKNFTFHYPGSWKADDSAGRVRLTASDGSHYFLLKDTLAPFPAGTPSSDPELLRRATELVKPLLKEPEFIGVQTVTMDHGEGAVFRFRAKGATVGSPTLIYLAAVGTHTLALLPEKAGQPSQSIGLASVFQSIAFADALPRQPAAPQRPGAANRGTTGAASIAGIGTISFSKQIAPILNSKCEVCHRTRSPLGGLSVDSYAEFIKGGSHGSTVVPGSPQASLLMDYLTGKRSLMPKGGPPLPDDQIALIRKWIEEGAKEEIGSASPDMTGNTSQAATPGRLRKGGQRTGVGGNAARAARNRQNGVASGRVAPQPSDLLEAYSGHLVSNDLGFTLRLNQNKTASALWSLSPGQDLRYSGTYVGDEGSYLVTMTEVSSGAPTGRSLLLNLSARGGQETGLFGENGSEPRRNVALLELSETASTSKGGGRIAPRNATTAGRKRTASNRAAANRTAAANRRAMNNLKKRIRAAERQAIKNGGLLLR